MKYLGACSLFIIGDEVVSLLALSILMLMAGADLMKERLSK